MGETFFILLICFVMILWLRGQISDKFYHLSKKIDQLTEELRELKRRPQAPEHPQEEFKYKPAEPVMPVVPEPEVKAREPEWKEPIVEEQVEEEVVFADFESEEVLSPEPAEPVYSAPSKEPKKTFFETYPDLEKFIGENLINKIGIGVLVLGIAFFVKYAIDQNWIGPVARAGIGILCGGILIAIAHRMRKSFNAFSSVLVAGGLAVLYFTITIAFQQYGLFNQTVAFAIMVVITAFAVLLSLAYDRMELAVIAIIGGFATPFMVSHGDGNYVVLFTYLLILNTGMLTLAYFKRWNLVNIVCYVFTIILYGSWLSTKVVNTPNAPYLGALIFATLFYFIFFLMNIIYNVKERAKFLSIEISILLSNTFLYYAAGMLTLKEIHSGDYQGLFTVLVGVFNCIFAFSLYKNERVDRNLVFLLIGLVLTFISLAAPVQLEGNHITLFWSVESVLLLWLSQKSGIKLIKIASLVVLFLMICSLLIDWSQLYYTYSTTVLHVIINKAFITSIVSIFCIFANIRLLKNETDDFFAFKEFPVKLYKIALYIISALFIYISILNELTYQLEHYVDFYQNRNIILACYNLTFLAALLLITRRIVSDLLQGLMIMLSAIAVLVYFILLNDSIIEVRDAYLTAQPSYLGFFLAHYYLAGMLVVSLLLVMKRLSARFQNNVSQQRFVLWAFTFTFVYIASAELDHLVVLLGYHAGSSIDSIVDQNHKIGYPILWGVCSFLMMFAGMKSKKRDIRILSLSLFFITLLKLFMWDIRGVSEGGKIGAFISLGILLLIISFMYQRLKKLILDDDALKAAQQEQSQPE
jgi:uncharacterized membrane protein